MSPNIRTSHSDLPDHFIQPLQAILESTCGAKVLRGNAVTRDVLQKPGRHVIEIPFKDVSRLHSQDVEDVQQQLDVRDDTVSSIISAMRAQDYTLIYYSTPSTSHQDDAGEYIMDDDVVAHQLNAELKRDLSADGSGSSFHVAAGNNTLVDGPLFDRYQFTTPGKPPYPLIVSTGPFLEWETNDAAGLFMGFFAAIVLLSLLWVGLTGLSSLQVTYGAFEKEQGQLAGKKSS